MPSTTRTALCSLLLCLTGLLPQAAAQVTLGLPGYRRTDDLRVHWRGNPYDAVDRARGSGLPLLVWVPEDTGILEEDTYRSAQRRAFDHPLVARLINDRFIPIRMNQAFTIRYDGPYAYQAPLLPVPYGPSLSVLAPDGARIATFSPSVATDPFTLTDQLAAASHSYRDYLFRTYLRPVLMDPAASRDELRDALDLVWRLDIYSADNAVSRLAQNPPGSLNLADQRNLFRLLARLATPTTIAALLEASREFPDARDALADAPRRAADFLRPNLDDEDPLRRRLASDAIAAITGRRPSPGG